MNLALPTLLILLALLPGIVFLRAYLGGKFSRRIVQPSTLGEIALYIVLAIPLDAIALACMDDHPTRAHLIFGVLTGNVETSGAQQSFRDLIGDGLHSFWEYVLILVLAWVGGILTRRTVWTFRLDLWLPGLRMKHAWYYILQGRDRDLPRRVLPIARAPVIADPRQGLRQVHLLHGTSHQLTRR